jgi:hypothetical protein
MMSSDDLINQIISNLIQNSGLKKNEIEGTILNDFKEKSFKDILLSVDYKINSEEGRDLSKIKYVTIFNKYTDKLLQDEDFQEKLQKYLEIYDDLINKSKILKRTDSSVFDHNNIKDIVDNLDKNSFFYREKLNHSDEEETDLRLLRIWIDGKYENIESSKKLTDIINGEIKEIESNTVYQKAFSDLNKKLQKPQAAKEFWEFIRHNKSLLKDLKKDNLELFKKQIWTSLLHKNLLLCNQAIQYIKDSKCEVDVIKKEIQNPESIKNWNNIIGTFNKHFLALDKKLILDKD